MKNIEKVHKSLMVNIKDWRVGWREAMKLDRTYFEKIIDYELSELANREPDDLTIEISNSLYSQKRGYIKRTKVLTYHTQSILGYNMISKITIDVEKHELSFTNYFEECDKKYSLDTHLYTKNYNNGNHWISSNVTAGGYCDTIDKHIKHYLNDYFNWFKKVLLGTYDSFHNNDHIKYDYFNGHYKGITD